MKKILSTPINAGELDSINIGDVIYLNGTIVTCRDIGHRRLIEQNIALPINLRDCAIFHAGPIVRKTSEGNYEMVSIGPTTSMRMEKFEKEFIKRTGVRVIVGKGGMGADTAEGCKLYKAIHCVFPAGCAVLAASAVEEITDVQWTELGMPESLWVMRVKELGPLIVSIDTKGNNLFEIKKAIYNERKKAVLEQIVPEVRFIK